MVVYLKELLPTGYEDFEKVKEKVKEKLIEEKAQSLMLQKAQEVAKALKEGKKTGGKVPKLFTNPYHAIRCGGQYKPEGFGSYSFV